MEEIEKIFFENPQIKAKPKLFQKRFVFNCDDKEFTGYTIQKIIVFINSIKKNYKKGNVPIHFNFSYNNIVIADKLSYVIFECICYALKVKYGHEIHLSIKPKENILTSGVFSSPLLLLLNGSNKSSKKKYVDKFKFDIYSNHYRKVITKSSKEYLSIVFSDIFTFLNNFPITDDSKEQIAEVVSELVGNACEHTGSSCLIDLDVTEKHTEKDNPNPDEKFIGINIAVINFSGSLLGNDLEKKIRTNANLTERYKELADIFEIHKEKMTGNEYDENDFWNVACMQDRISGRMQYNKTGGTGSTILINSLQKKAKEDNCYVLSGRNVLYYKKEMLNYDNNEWISFNNTNFHDDIPSRKVIGRCPVYIPGTAYNLNFVLRVEGEEDDND